MFANSDPFVGKHRLVVLIHCNSNAAIAKIKNYCYNGKRRQVRRKHIIIRECISKVAIRVDHVCNDGT